MDDPWRFEQGMKMYVRGEPTRVKEEENRPSKMDSFKTSFDAKCLVTICPLLYQMEQLIVLNQLWLSQLWLSRAVDSAAVF